MSWHYSDQWAAGFFDGEGCVSISKRQRTIGFIEHHLSVQIGQNDRRPLDALAEKYGGGITKDTRPKPFWRWRVHGRRAQFFLETILPFSLIKRMEIKAALQLRKAIGKPGSRMVTGAWERKEVAYANWRKARGLALPA